MGGATVDASIIEAPSSTKDRSGERDPEMHQTKEGNQWHFGMKVHIEVDADTGLVHSMSATPANVLDVTEATACCSEAKRWCGVMRATRETRSWGGRWNGGWRCLLGGGGCRSPGVRRIWQRRPKHR